MLSWPKPQGSPQLSACHFCDTLHEAPQLKEGMAAYCLRCGAVIYQNRPASLVRACAFSLSALLLMVLVHSFPFLTMDSAGLRRELTLVNAATALIMVNRMMQAPRIGASSSIRAVAALTNVSSRLSPAESMVRKGKL